MAVTFLKCRCCVEVQTFGARRAVAKCFTHVQASINHREGPEYYAECAGHNHVQEFINGFGGEIEPGNGKKLLEIGCGISSYVDMVKQKGYIYSGIDTSEYAVNKMRESGHDVHQIGATDEAICRFSPDVILAPHILEHLQDAPQALRMWVGMLPRGGRLYLIIPDDTDLCNPDHWWFFNEMAIRQYLQHAGMQIESSKMKRVVKHENFIYVKVRKP